MQTIAQTFFTFNLNVYCCTNWCYYCTNSLFIYVQYAIVQTNGTTRRESKLYTLFINFLIFLYIYKMYLQYIIVQFYFSYSVHIFYFLNVFVQNIILQTYDTIEKWMQTFILFTYLFLHLLYLCKILMYKLRNANYCTTQNVTVAGMFYVSWIVSVWDYNLHFYQHQL